MSTAKLFLAAMAMAAVFFVGVNARVAAHYNNHEVSCHSLSFFFCHEKVSFDNARSLQNNLVLSAANPRTT